MITGATRTFALLGHPIAASRSPELHNAWAREHGIDAVYVALDVSETRGEGVVSAVRTLGLAGVNLTVPLKERVMRHLDRLEPAAAAAGAVNTLYWDGGRLAGANTDGEGLLRSLAAGGTEVSGRRVAVIGAGGAGRGVAAAMVAAGVDELRLLNRTVGRARAVAEALSDRRVTAGPLDADLGGIELVVVCTSAPPSRAATPGAATWIDISTRTPEGLRMLCWQGALAFERWTGVRPDAEAAWARLTLPRSGDS